MGPDDFSMYHDIDSAGWQYGDTLKYTFVPADSVVTGDMALSLRHTNDYIYSNIKERITIADLAAYTGLSESYLSRVFKQNLGVSISDYIREKKIEKATHLLKYSDKPIIDIANYLSFSSQSHFIQIFEGFMGLTPKKYRDRYYKSMW